MAMVLSQYEYYRKSGCFEHECDIRTIILVGLQKTQNRFIDWCLLSGFYEHFSKQLIYWNHVTRKQVGKFVSNLLEATCSMPFVASIGNECFHWQLISPLKSTGGKNPKPPLHNNDITNIFISNNILAHKFELIPSHYAIDTHYVFTQLTVCLGALLTNLNRKKDFELIKMMHVIISC